MASAYWRRTTIVVVHSAVKSQPAQHFPAKMPAFLGVTHSSQSRRAALRFGHEAMLRSKARSCLLLTHGCRAVCASTLLRRHFPGQAALTRTAPTRRYLEQLEDLVAEARVVPLRHGASGSARMANEDGKMPCHDCGRYLPHERFSKSKTRCKQCDAESSRAYRRSLRGMANMLAQAGRSRDRLKGRLGNITRDDVLSMLLQQQGLCAYSGVPMEILLPHSDWRMSLERVNNSVGYSRANCVLVAAEFNSTDHTRRRGVKQEEIQGSAQWSAEKVQSLQSVWDFAVDTERLDQDAANALHRRGLKSDTVPDNVCPYRRTLRGRAKTLASHARWHAKALGLSCDVGYTDILQLLLQQSGRCFYSGVPLQYRLCHTDWVMSLERLDNTSGYIKGNYVLIAAEFNTPDRSSFAVQEVHGTSQWSLAKVLHVWGRAGFLSSDLGQCLGQSDNVHLPAQKS